MPFGIHFLMQDPDNQNILSPPFVEYGVADMFVPEIPLANGIDLFSKMRILS